MIEPREEPGKFALMVFIVGALGVGTLGTFGFGEDPAVAYGTGITAGLAFAVPAFILVWDPDS